MPWWKRWRLVWPTHALAVLSAVGGFALTGQAVIVLLSTREPELGLEAVIAILGCVVIARGVVSLSAALRDR